MSFTGDLEHLPIVDVIQLLHSTRKSGTLWVRGRKGESQLVFKDGFIVSANHPNNHIRIGRLLAESGAISAAALEQALELQQHSPGERRPLVAILIEGGALDREAAYRGLTALIEITIVEMLRNVRGTFALDVERFEVSDEFRYFPEHLQQELSLNTQMVLMDALRLFDERNRDGLQDQPLFDDEVAAEPPTAPATEPGPTLSAADLGLADLDQLERSIPDIFTPLGEADPAQQHREALAEILTACPGAGLDQYVDFLTALSASGAPAKETQPERILVLFSPDPLLRHGLATLGRHDGQAVFTTSDTADLGPMLAQFSARGEQPLLLLDAPAATEEAGAAAAALLQQLRREHDQLPLLQLVHPGDYELSLLALRQGASLILPRPPGQGENPQLGAQLIATLQLVRAALVHPALVHPGLRQPASPWSDWSRFHGALLRCQEPAEISSALLQAVAQHFPRALTLVVAKGELIVERALGFGPGGLPKLRLPLAESGLLRQTIDQGELHFGPAPQPLLPEPLRRALGPVANPSCLLLPLQLRGRTAALIYADFARQEPTGVPLELLLAQAQYAELALDNALYRKQLEKPA
jgi:Domain of unknown function (DUF4388)